MRAVIQLANHEHGYCSAKTENDLVVAFQVVDGTKLRPGEEIEIELPDVLKTKLIHRTLTARPIRIELRRHDVHDLRGPFGGHGTPSSVSEARMVEK